jgi:peptide/nickel transport system substrate-binding protein
VRSVALAAATALVLAACGAAGDERVSPTPVPESDIPRGGTVRFAALGDVSAAFDPQKEYYQVSLELFRCCLVRTLFATNGRPVDEGGSALRPDIAAEIPTLENGGLSDDGLTWTITLKNGIFYSPPFEDVEVTAADFIRAMEREADPAASAGGYSFYYNAIEGFVEFSEGEADSISGLSAPDDNTLQVTVTEPTGDLGWRLAMPASAPIPPNGGDRLGAAEGHTANYGRFLVATGPYMFEGTDQLDFSVPARDREHVSGYIPGRQIVLVRNPSWDQATDELRPAYVDRMEVTIGGEEADIFNKIEAGLVDYALDAFPPPNVLREYSTNPDKQPFLHVYPQNVTSYMSMNLAVPPFDDIHVRKAVNFALNKAGGIQLGGGPLVGTPAGHIFPDGLLNNLLKDYQPYESPGNSGDIDAAQTEMAQSRYDSDGDGVCDDPVCERVLTVQTNTDPGPSEAQLWADNLEPLGITLDIKLLEHTTMYSKCNNLAARIPLCPGVGWIQDYPDAYTFGPPLFGSEGLYPGCCNYSALGASPAQLKEWGYSVTSVPNVDDRLDECAVLPVGDERYQCWAELDRYLMEEVVPWVPRTFTNARDITSTRVVNYSYSEWGAQAAFDHFAVAS